MRFRPTNQQHVAVHYTKMHQFNTQTHNSGPGFGIWEKERVGSRGLEVRGCDDRRRSDREKVGERMHSMQWKSAVIRHFTNVSDIPT